MVKLPFSSPAYNKQDAAVMVQLMEVVCAGAAKLFAGIKAGTCNCSRPLFTYITNNGMVHLSLNVQASLKGKVCTKGILVAGCSCCGVFIGSHFIKAAAMLFAFFYLY